MEKLYLFLNIVSLHRDLVVGGEGDDIGWDGWMASPTRWPSLGVCDVQGGLACCDSWGCKESDTTEPLNWTELEMSAIKKNRRIFKKQERAAPVSRKEAGFIVSAHQEVRGHREQLAAAQASWQWNVVHTVPGKQRLFWWPDQFCCSLRIKHFPGVTVVKSLPASAKDTSLILRWEEPLEKEIATHSSILAWKIPWTEEPGGLQSLR